MTTKPIHPDIPTTRAWQEGRRLYIRCARGSRLNTQLRDLGAHWDPEHRALWVGSGKRDAVVAAVQATEARLAEVNAIKAANRWVAIPYDATDIRARAKDLGAVWGGDDSRVWYLPSDESYAEIAGLVNNLRAQIEAKRQEERAARRARWDAEKQARRHTEALDADRDRERIIAATGRTPTGKTAELREISTARMNKHTARESARPLGSVVRLRDGRYGLITGVKIWFTGEEMASSACWHPETHDQPHWDFLYQVEIVAPTPAEQTKDERKAAEQADAATIHDLMRDAPTLTGARAADRHTPIPGDQRAGTITLTTGTTGFPDGHLILTTDNRVVWQHPGYYDDYIPTEGTSADPGLVERVRAVLAAGPRTRTVHDQTIHRYEIQVGDDG